MEHQEQPARNNNFHEDLTMKINIGNLPFQNMGRINPSSTSDIIASIKPLPPGILSGMKSPKDKIEVKPAVNLYNIVKLPMAIPIKSKDKKKEEEENIASEKERGFKDKFPKDKLMKDKIGKNTSDKNQIKKQMSPIQMNTSIMGQTVMFQQSFAKAVPPVIVHEKKTEEPVSEGLSMLKYITVSVKARRILYEKENFYIFLEKIEDYLSNNREEIRAELDYNIKDYRTLIVSEIEKMEEKVLPPEAGEDFVKAKKMLLQAIGGFREAVDDLKYALEDRDLEIFDDAKFSIEKSYEDMELFSNMRDRIKEHLSS